MTLDSNGYADIGIDYPQDALDLATMRGWDGDAHEDAILATDDDAITLTHPSNWLFEGEVETTWPGSDL